jgi:hypothetical protein
MSIFLKKADVDVEEALRELDISIISHSGKFSSFQS